MSDEKLSQIDYLAQTVELLSVENEALRAENARLKDAEDMEHRIWIKALLKHIPEEKAVLFKNICVTADELRSAAREELGNSNEKTGI